MLRNSGLAEYSDKTGFYFIRLTPLGREARKLGSYTKLLEKQNEKEDLTNRKLKIDVANAKRIYKTYWYTFVLALLAFVISLILLILKLKE